MQLLIDKFNEILGNEIYIHNINNTKEVKESVVEGILKTYGGSIVAGADNSYVNEVIDTYKEIENFLTEISDATTL